MPRHPKWLGEAIHAQEHHHQPRPVAAVLGAVVAVGAGARCNHLKTDTVGQSLQRSIVSLLRTQLCRQRQVEEHHHETT